MSLLSDAVQLHANRLHESAGESVTYVRGATQITCVEATRGQTQFEEQASEMDAVIQSKSLDWLIRPAQLVISGSAIVPVRGDKIVTASGDTYEVFPGADTKHWQYTDQYETLFRIHTVKRV